MHNKSILELLIYMVMLGLMMLSPIWSPVLALWILVSLGITSEWVILLCLFISICSLCGVLYLNSPRKGERINWPD